MASERPKRKAIPLRVKLDAALIALGLDPKATEFDHDPALGLRPVNADGDDFDPPQLDPRHIVPRGCADHRTKTTGTPPGQKVVTVANGDQHKIAKAKRLEDDRIRRPIKGFKPDDPLPTNVLSVFGDAERATRSQWPKGRKIQSRGFQKKPQ